MKVKELLADPAKWTKGSFARDLWGVGISPVHNSAVCFCVLGAAHICYPSDAKHEIAIKSIANVLKRRNIKASISDFNDDPATTHADVMSVLNEADV